VATPHVLVPPTNGSAGAVHDRDAEPRGVRRAGLAAVLRLELAEVLRSRWIVFCAAVYALLGVTFVLVGARESTVVGFTGMGRTLLSFTHVLVFLLPLLALTATGQVVNTAREEGALELLFGNPLRREEWFLGVTLVRVGVLAVPLLVAVPGLALVGWVAFREPVPWGWMLRALAVGTTLLACFVAIGLLVSTTVRSTSRALIVLLVVWCASVALIDFGLVGLMLQSHVEPRLVFLLAALNPVQGARMALLSAADAELATLGPVGFYLANHVGTFGLLLIGTLWPALLGAELWVVAATRFRRSDVV
jgi:ABC-type transport system involved in multi-copper enzyme maturation permease subunit